MPTEFLLNSLHKNQHWLTEPRFALVLLPLMLAGVLSSSGYSDYAMLPIMLSALGICRLVWFKLLPHEAKRLASARQALAAARPDEAVQLLQLPIFLSGKHYELQRVTLLSKAYIRDGQFIEAHRILNTVDEKSLLPSETAKLNCAWSQLFLKAGNPTEAALRLEGIPANYRTYSMEYLLTKACVERDLGHWTEARNTLETGLDKNPKNETRVLLLNDLATVEHLQGRADMQLRYLQAALSIFRNTPHADLTSVLHHNLAIALARANRPEEARQVLREAWSAGDYSNLRHVLEVLNNSLYAAREAGDPTWKSDVYEEFERQLVRFSSVSPREQLALDVSQLRMRRNDGLPFQSSEYVALIRRLLERLDNPTMTIPDNDRVAALCEICNDLNHEIKTQLTPDTTAVLVQLLRRSCEQLLEKRAIVDAHLSALSPKLTEPLNTWRRYQTCIDKSNILLAQSDEALLEAFSVLFQHLREKAEWQAEQGISRQSLEAWLVLCDEYLAYRNQLRTDIQANWHKCYFHIAEYALNQTIQLLEANKAMQNHVDILIGVAYFALQLQNDESTATKYITVVNNAAPALDHFATWLRDQYHWVLKRLSRRLSPNSN